MNPGHSLHADAPAYAIGALDADERLRFEYHLADCVSCRAELESFDPIRRELESIPIPPPPSPPRPPYRPTLRRPEAWLAPIRVAAFAAAAAVGAAFVATPSFERFVADERAYVEIARMLASDPIEVALSGPNGASGRAIVGDGRALSGFIVRGLPKPRPGFVYRVWVRGNSMRRSPGVLERTREGLDVLIVSGDALARANVVRVMLERVASNASAESTPKAVLEGRVRLDAAERVAPV
jgi:hypothetical protein